MTSTEERLLAVLSQCREQPTQVPHPRFSSALSCLRSHVYDARLVKLGAWPKTSARPVRWVMAAAVGTALGDLIERAARQLGASTQARCELGEVVGNLDIEWADLDAVWDVKLVGDYAWREAKKGPDPKHVAQIQGYCAARKRANWALLYFPIASLGKGDGVEYLIHEGRADADAARRDVTERWAQVASHLAANSLPEREVDEHTCRRLRCMHLNECRGG